MELVNELRPHIAPNPETSNYRAVVPEQKVALTLYYLQDKGSITTTANTFCIAGSTAGKIMFDVCYAISRTLGPRLLHLPIYMEEMKHKVSQFEVEYGKMQAFGCNDGTHIPIMCPKENSQDYVFYKFYHSLNVKAVCGCKGLFLHVEFIWPGSAHDSKVLANPLVNEKPRDGLLPIIYQSVGENNVKIPIISLQILHIHLPLSA